MRVLDLSQTLNDFDGTPIPIEAAWLKTKEDKPVGLLLEVVDRNLLKQAFAGIELKLSDPEPATVKWALLQYLQHFNYMGLSKDQQDKIYELGFRIATTKAALHLDEGVSVTTEYDAVKAMCDIGQRRVPGEPERDTLRLPVMRFRLRALVNNAPVIADAKEKKE